MDAWDTLVLRYRETDLSKVFSSLGISGIDKSAYNGLKIASLSQWIVESGRGNSGLAKVHYNFGGLKWREEMSSFAGFSAAKTSYSAHDGVDDYCRFPSIEAFITGYWKFISRSPYEGWETRTKTPSDYIHYIGHKYATDPKYSEKVIAYFEESRTLLDFDRGSSDLGHPGSGSGDRSRPALKKFIQSPNFDSRHGVDIDTIVIHYTTGSLQSAISTFKSDAEQVSAHYIVDKNGDIYQMVKDAFNAWHAGHKPTNQRSIGIEHVARQGERITPRQEASSIQLIQWLMAEYDIAKERIIPHKKVGRFTACPGELFGDRGDSEKIDNFNEWVDKHFSREPRLDIEDVRPEETEEIYIVQPGDTVTKIASFHDTTLENLLVLNPELRDAKTLFTNQKIVVFRGKEGQENSFFGPRALKLPLRISEKTLSPKTYQRFSHISLGDMTITGGYMEGHHAHSKKLAMKAIFLDGNIRTLPGGVRRNIGIDYSVAPQKVRAWYDGKITKRGLERGYGRRVHMLLDALFEYKGKQYQVYQAFAHLRKFLAPLNQKVSQGDLVGMMGGSSTRTISGRLEVIDDIYPLHVDLSTYCIMGGERVEIHPQLLDDQLS